MNLENKTIIVTGSSDGIGKEIAIQLSKQNTNIALIARNEEKLNLVKKECEKNTSGEVKVYSCDISNTQNIKSTIESIKEDFGKINGLVNNAGIWQKLDTINNIDDDKIEQIIQTNLQGLITMTKYTMNHLLEQEDCALINVSSKSGTVAQKGQSVYTATKYGVKGFTDVLREDFKETQLRISGIYQAGTNTGMFSKADQDFPIEKFTNPKDLADVIVFILSAPDKIWLKEVHVEF